MSTGMPPGHSRSRQAPGQPSSSGDGAGRRQTAWSRTAEEILWRSCGLKEVRPADFQHCSTPSLSILIGQAHLGDSSLKAWLNVVFLNAAFGEENRKPQSGVLGGELVFLLTESDAETYHRRADRSPSTPTLGRRRTPWTNPKPDGGGANPRKQGERRDVRHQFGGISRGTRRNLLRPPRLGEPGTMPQAARAKPLMPDAPAEGAGVDGYASAMKNKGGSCSLYNCINEPKGEDGC